MALPASSGWARISASCCVAAGFAHGLHQRVLERASVAKGRWPRLPAAIQGECS
jgi:hypothetical protein